MSVAKAVLTVTANNAGMVYGQPLPAFTSSITGFVNNDPTLQLNSVNGFNGNVTLNCSGGPSVVSGTATETTTATSASIPGNYPITFSATTLAATNYTFTYVTGTLTISGGAAQSITFNPLPNRTLGSGAFALTATLALAETIDNGKPIRETRAADVPLSIDHFRYFASCIRAEEGSAGELDNDTVAYHFKEPMGVVGQIIPWNFPLLMAAWKIAPAIAAGNCTVLKPASNTPLSLMTLIGPDR